MIRMFIRHPVEDYARWRQGYDDFDEERKGMGVCGDAVFQSTDDPNDVTVWPTSRRSKPPRSSTPRPA
jgi:hypothetical protein